MKAAGWAGRANDGERRKCAWLAQGSPPEVLGLDFLIFELLVTLAWDQSQVLPW